MGDEKQAKSNSRREFLKNSGLAIGGLVVGGVVGGALMGKNGQQPAVQEHEHAAATTAENYNQALMFFNQEQFKIAEAAAEVIFPKTESGPGAKELLVAYYMDHQLGGAYGLNTKEYMSGPFYFAEAVPEQGYQTHLNRQQIFLLGLEALNAEAAKRFSTKEKADVKFYDLTEEQQIEILKDVEDDKVKLNGAANASMFFDLLKGLTMEGVYADPMYGGNKDMAGWKMKNFPGHQMNYTKVVTSKEFVKMDPQSLHSQHKQ
ncbi:gluconate 2-dehydrogenase subunit 3 family protein [Brevibacillus fulvus]|uniref:Gluconate 2-dehydrogenase gamma chain n=1 Tax=Brevibacillus fulvus TaxID=1125967 RepID=A0A938XXL1_9BACL|nr:gluconate 2-dehydrogenase gamma chain [Brevibacillus fulvus]